MNLSIEELEEVIWAVECIQNKYEWPNPVIAKAHQKLLDQLADTLDNRYSD